MSSPISTKVNSYGRQDRELLHRIQRLVPIEHTSTTIAGQTYPWTQVINPDQLLEQALSQHDRSLVEVDPFWAANWRAAIGLDRFLDRFDLKGQHVLELGCGSGRAGISAALRGASVTMTDVVGQALLVAKFNARFVRTSVNVRRLEWKNEQLSFSNFRFILGSDIVYDPALHPILEPCLRRHLGQNGTVLLSEPQRHTGDRFRRWIMAAGWQVQEHFIDLEDDNRNIRIFALTLS